LKNVDNEGFLTKYQGGDVIFTVQPKPFSLRCPECGSRKVIRRGTIPRLFRTLPIGGKAVWLSLAVQRVQCLVCGVLRQARIGFADPRRTYTRAFERYALELSKRMTILDTARHLGVSWDVIKDIQKRYLGRRFSKPKLHRLLRHKFLRSKAPPIHRLVAEATPYRLKQDKRSPYDQNPGSLNFMVTSPVSGSRRIIRS
jgi:transposase